MPTGFVPSIPILDICKLKYKSPLSPKSVGEATGTAVSLSN